VARLLRDQMQQHEAQFAMIEQLTGAAAAMALEACAVPIAGPPSRPKSFQFSDGRAKWRSP